jgi:hypothetical protein
VLLPTAESRPSFSESTPIASIVRCSGPSFHNFVQPLNAPQFSTVREISFVVNGSPFCLRSSARHAREYFELLLPAVCPHGRTAAIYVSTGRIPTKYSVRCYCMDSPTDECSGRPVDPEKS